MSANRFQHIRRLFELASELPPEERRNFLDDRCGDDGELRTEVERLLELDDQRTRIEPETRSFDSGSSPRKSGGRIGPYRLLRPIGEGGMGIVWEAEQLQPVRRTVALKLVKHGMSGSQILARFESERQALALMSHPNVAKVLDAGTDESGAPYFAMEFIKGDPITQYCDRNRLSTSDRLQLLIQVCDGVHHAHQKGILHRDLSPSNVLVEIQDGRPVPRIIDFGIAKALDQNLTERTLFTEYGQILGKPEYMSPEQADLTGVDVDTRTDVYSLGVILYELLVGVLPFDSRELRSAGFDAMRRRIREDTPHKPSTRLTTLGRAGTTIAEQRRSNPSTLLKSCRGDLDWITMKALEKDRTRRYGSASDFAADLRRHMDNEPVTAGPPSATYRVGKFVRRHRTGVATAAAFALVVIAALLVTSFALIWSRRAEEEARQEARRANTVSDFLVDLFDASSPARAQGEELTAHELLDYGAERIRDELAEEPVTRARILHTIGRTYMRLGLYPSAEPLLEESRRLHEFHLGPVDEATNEVVGTLSRLYRIQDRGDEQLGLASEQYERLRDALGSRHPRTLEAYRAVGAAQLENGQIEAAGATRREVLEVRREMLGPDHPETLESEHDLGVWLADAGQDEESLEILAPLLERLRSSGGEDEAIIDLHINLFGLNSKLRRYEESEHYASEGLALALQSYGPSHPKTLMLRNRLGLAYMYQGRWRDAEEVFAENVTVKRRVLGDSHSNVHHDMLNLGHVLGQQGRWEEVLPLVTEVYEHRLETLGADHFRTVNTQAGIAETYIRIGRFDDAQRVLADAIDNALQSGRMRQAHLTKAFSLACDLQDSGGRSQAAGLAPRLSIALAAYENDLLGQPDTQPSDWNNLAWVFLTACVEEVRDLDKALLYAHRADDATQHADPDIVDTLALALHRTGQSVEAAQLLENLLQNLNPEQEQARIEIKERLNEIRQ